MEWIKVSDRLPDDDIDVLFLDNCSEMHKGYYSCVEKCWFINTNGLSVDGNANIVNDDFDPSYITHWQPLPELLKETP